MWESVPGEPKARETEATQNEVANKQPEATSKETLSDLEQRERISDSKPGPAEQTSVPAPDGQVEERRGGPDDAGPM